MSTLYPIYCPVLLAQVEPLARLGAMSATLSPALDCFSNSQRGLTFPNIGPYWNGVQAETLSDKTSPLLVDSARRLHEEAQMIAARYRDYENRLAPDATVRFQIGQTDADGRLEQARQRKMWAEMRAALPAGSLMGFTLHKPGAWHLHFATLPGRSTYPETVFVNEDRRCIHLSQFFGDSFLLGYGMVSGAMHYIEIGPKSPTGRSRALFLRDMDSRTALTAAWFGKSLNLFYGAKPDPQHPTISGRGRLTGTDRVRKVKYESAQPISLLDEPAFLAEIDKLAPDQDISLQTEEVIQGKRGSAMSNINIIIPLGTVRRSASTRGLALHAFYVPETVQALGEASLTPEIRRRLQFSVPSAPRTP